MIGALDEIYRRHGHVVVRRASEILGSSDEAKDVLHDLFVELARDPSVVRGTVTGWLYARTTFACLDRLRRRRRRDSIRARNVLEPSTAPASDELVALRELFVRLPDELAAIAVYYYLDGMTHAEIAATLGRSRRHVGNQLARVLEWAERERRSA